jgi:hypothetical protein
MATSGSTNFSMTARDVITKALRKAFVIGELETPSASEAADALQSLNLMLKSWSAKRHLFIIASTSVTLLASTASYSLANARRVRSVRRRTSSVDTPLYEMSRQEYDDTPMKASIGFPNGFYFDPQRATRTLYVWPVPDASIATSTTLQITYERVLEDVDSLNDDLDVPQEWLECIVYNLAARLGPEFGVGATNPDFALVLQTAQSLLMALNADDEEDASIYFRPTSQ